jgi:hypothetical protein
VLRELMLEYVKKQENKNDWKIQVRPY